MNGAYEGDLIRPLGLVTLYFGYAEFEVNSLIKLLGQYGVSIKISDTASLGLRVDAFINALEPLKCDGVVEVLEILAEAKTLLEQRNNLIHGAVFSQGRVVPSNSAKNQFYVTPESLSELADKAFNWKERLNSKIQRRLIPALCNQ
jgi:c-di-GMP-related signal transduction protein